MGDRGRLVVPAELRERAHLESGVPLTMVETDRGIVLLTRDQFEQWVREVDRRRGVGAAGRLRQVH